MSVLILESTMQAVSGCRDAVSEVAVMVVRMSLTVVVVVVAAAVVDQFMFVMMVGNDDESDDEDDDDDDDGRGRVKLQGTRLRHFKKPWSITTPLSITIAIGIETFGSGAPRRLDFDFEGEYKPRGSP